MSHPTLAQLTRYLALDPEVKVTTWDSPHSQSVVVRLEYHVTYKEMMAGNLVSHAVFAPFERARLLADREAIESDPMFGLGED